MQVKTATKATDIRYLKGVGPRKSELLNRLGISTVEDLLYCLPRRYEDRSKLEPIKDLRPGEYAAVRGTVLTFGANRTKRGMSVFRVAVGGKTGIIYCVWFNQPFLKKFFKRGQEIIVYGKVEKYDRLQINHPEYEIVKDNCDRKRGQVLTCNLSQKNTKNLSCKLRLDPFSLNIGRIVPVYPLTRDVTQRYMRFLTDEAIRQFLFSVKEKIPVNIRARLHLADVRFALKNIHFPASFENLDKAYKRLVFEEFFILQLAFALKRKDIKAGPSGITHKLNARLWDSFKNLLNFKLTDSQLKVINEIQIDMANPKPMNRLLEGDVGSGKTVVAVYALLLTVENGYQAAVMAPTEILARQHYITISELLMPLGVNVRLLVSGMDPRKKLEIKNDIENGEANVVIGTHALIREDVDFKKVGLVVIDEQHKFGVSQRQLLGKKGLNPDVLLMTATPIPRTLAMTVYGDLDISVIKELPKGRRPITTYCLEEAKRPQIYQFIREEIKKGRQAYIVYPRVWSDEVEAGNVGATRRVAPTKAAAFMYNQLQEEAFPDLKLGLIHGRMKVREKDGIMKKFKSKKIDILVSTTVIEVGIDIANASLMLIENAEHFGLSQLHQLRGRIGRGDFPSYCILLGNPGTEAAQRRFDTMARTQDGFEVAEEDMEQRGPGEFLGTMQHGLPEIRFGNILRDFDVMEQARSEAFALIERDPRLEDPRNAFVKAALKTRFAGKLELASVG